ncbi:MAG: hypothetical protein HUJ25_05910 [Crocinitomicaceae bacterium]|nr:hypothetical protein [Crocinitomicaceae bacterium]
MIPRVLQLLLPIFTIGLFTFCSGESEEDTGDGEQVNTDFTYDFSEIYPLKSIHPPLENANVPVEEMEVNNDQEYQVVMESGSFIDIPKDAFVDENGELITSPVKLQYREFHDPTEFLVSGIPMALSGDENGVEIFESAGMIEINATADGKPVFPNEDNPVLIGMGSNVDGNYPLYKFEEEEGWSDPDSLDLMNEEDMDELAQERIPSAPVLNTGSLRLFTISDETVDSKPSLEKWRGYEFLPLDMDKSNKLWSRYISDISVKHVRGHDYILTITEWGNEPMDLPVIRVYDSKNHAKVYEEWKKKYWKKRRLQRSLEKARDKLKRKKNLYLRSFEIASFGIFNCDRASRVQFADFTYEINGEQSADWNVYCVDFTIPAKYPCIYGGKIGIDPYNDYALFSKREDGVYIATVKECENAFKNDHFNFKLKKIADDITLEELGPKLVQ